MSDRIFFPLAGLGAVAMIALALTAPQGDGRRSPRPFGHETTADAAARLPKLRSIETRPKKAGIL